MENNKKKLKEFNLRNLKLSFYFAYERYNIYVKKEIEKLKPPWTKDIILQQLRFCNLHREHDNVSRTIISCLNLLKNNVKQLIFNAINFRRLNNNYTIVKVSQVLNLSTYTPLKYVQSIECGYEEQLQYEGAATYFDSAYVIAPIGGEYYRQLILRLPIYYGTNKNCCIRISNASYEKEKDLFDKIKEKIHLEIVKKRTNLKICLFGIANLDIIEHHLDNIRKSKNSMGLFKEIEKISGIGEFIAGQIAVDIGYIRKDLFDENELAPAGPGCKKGLNLLYIEEVKQSANMNYVQNLLKNIYAKQDIIWKYFNYEKPTFGTMSLMTIENLMCETSKYIGEYNKQQNNSSSSDDGNDNNNGKKKKRKRPISRKKYHKRVGTRISRDNNGNKILVMALDDKKKIRT